eukprot:TRINITY_DN21317_c0_g2_i1.p1 TRINITY_DN21317_c0_g2~~TRINITY_DN21317_c0_g2_i1.p1  ORF type:complete len:399 (+),score=68.85 TRINITY_DN21317_c0_g2_i1:85-1281(+)
MCAAKLFVTVGLTGLAGLLTGCGDAGPSHDPAAGDIESVVIVMRHCVRSTDDDEVYGTPGFSYYDNYSAEPWPAFDVPPYYCLERGERIVEGTGRWIKALNTLPEPIYVIADDVERDIATGKALLKGMQLPATSETFRIVGTPFSQAEDCPKMTPAEMAAAVELQLAAYPWPEASFSNLMAQLYEAMGEGHAGNWTKTPCTLNNESGYLDGNCAAASAFVERFLMEWGGDITLAWQNIKPEQLPTLLQVHAWYRQVVDATPSVVANQEASIVRNVAEALDKAGTTIFVGHDSQLNALSAAFGIRWDASPFPINATLPGSLLRFDKRGDDVTASYSFVSNFSEASGSMTTVPAGPGEKPTGLTTLSALKASAQANSKAECANPLPTRFEDTDSNVAVSV